MLNKNYAVIIERYSWSGTLYSWASDSDPEVDPARYMLVDAGLPKPDLVVCVHTPVSVVLPGGGYYTFDFCRS